METIETILQVTAEPTTLIHIILNGVNLNGCHRETFDSFIKYQAKVPELKIAYHLVGDWIGHDMGPQFPMRNARVEFRSLYQHFFKIQKEPSSPTKDLENWSYICDVMSHGIIPEFFFDGIRLARELVLDPWFAFLPPKYDVMPGVSMYYWRTQKPFIAFMNDLRIRSAS